MKRQFGTTTPAGNRGAILVYSEWEAPEACRSDRDNLVRDLYLPALLSAKTYWRAAGFFSSSVFRALSDGFRPFFAEGGRMTLVTSPAMSLADIKAVGRGLIERDVSDLPGTVTGVFDGLAARRLSCSDVLRYLLHSGVLTVTIAFTRKGGHSMYHEKFSIFEDARRCRVMIAGSVNESENALVRNFERAEVWRGWVSKDEDRVIDRGREQFRRLLSGTTEGLEIVPLFRAYLDGRLKVTDADGWAPVRMAAEDMPPAGYEEALIPSTRELYPHQREAIRAWGAAGGRGILAMATGSGKTVTALSAAAVVYDRLPEKSLAVLIVAPLIHLVDQWRQTARDFGLDPIRCVEGVAGWRAELEAAIAAINSGARRIVSIATTPNTLQGAVFQAAIARLRKPLLIIGDEVHNYGAPAVADALPQNATLRIGLSATPERWLDPEGTAAVSRYFGLAVYEYGLADAIRDGVLTPYLYHPIIVGLDADEQDAFLEISAKLARFGFTGEESSLPDAAKLLMMKRARIVASAASKLPHLRELLRRDRSGTHILVYCGDGLVDADESMVRQIDEVIRIVGDELGMTCARYTAETPPQKRGAILEAFDEGRIQVLVAIRCLDEGVDVPSTRSAYILASSSNPRQFVQRRGRVLRLSPKTGKSVANIFDFFVSPPLPEAGTEDDPAQRAMRRLFGRQIGRVAEFSSLALNGAVARAPLVEISQKLGILEEWANERDERRRPGDIERSGRRRAGSAQQGADARTREALSEEPAAED